jgi:hypothetical protein
VAIWLIFPRFLCQEKSGNPACDKGVASELESGCIDHPDFEVEGSSPSPVKPADVAVHNFEAALRDWVRNQKPVVTYDKLLQKSSVSRFVCQKFLLMKFE